MINMEAKPIFIVRLPMDDMSNFRQFDFGRFKNELSNYCVIFIIDSIVKQLTFELFSPLTCNTIEIENLIIECEKSFENFSKLSVMTPYKLND
jgi:hypothetical protein